VDEVRVHPAARVEPPPHLALAMWNTRWHAAALVTCVRGVLLRDRAGSSSRRTDASLPRRAGAGAARALVPVLPTGRWLLVASEDDAPDDLPTAAATVPPTPAAIREVLDGWDVAPAAALGLAATPTDIELLRAAGCYVIALTTEHPLEELAVADAFAWDLDALDLAAHRDGGVELRVTRRA
jgi:hypothetical protein